MSQKSYEASREGKGRILTDLARREIAKGMTMTQALADALGTAPSLSDIGVEIEHHFGGRVYAKVTKIPALRVLIQHVHKHDHLSWLNSGSVMLEVEGHGELITGPRMIKIPAGKAHKVTALTSVIWLCLWATDETDPSKVDAGLIE